MSKVITAEDFSLETKKLAKADGGTLFQALSDMCEKYDIPHEDVKPYITEYLHEALIREGIQLKLLKQERRTRSLIR